MVGEPRVDLENPYGRRNVKTFETSKFLLQFLKNRPCQQFKSIEIAKALIDLYPEESEAQRLNSAKTLVEKVF